MPAAPTPVRTGIIGDIHLDLAGLEAVLAGPLAGCDRYVVTGDLLDRGPDDPREVLERVLALQSVVVLVGNHELAYLGGPRYGGMVEERCMPLVPRLRELVLDGRLRAAAPVGELLCTHGGVSRAYWRSQLADACGADAARIARQLNGELLRAVMRRSFGAPIFAALDSDVPGPFWASVREDLLDAGLPPFDQVVGHVALEREEWHHDQRGQRVYSVCRERSREGDAGIGCVVVTG